MNCWSPYEFIGGMSLLGQYEFLGHISCVVLLALLLAEFHYWKLKGVTGTI